MIKAVEAVSIGSLRNHDADGNDNATKQYI